MATEKSIKTLNDQLKLLEIDVEVFKASRYKEKCALLNKGLRTVASNAHPDKTAFLCDQYSLYKISDKNQINLNHIEGNAFILVGEDDSKTRTVYFVENQSLVKYGTEELTITIDLSEKHQKELANKQGKVPKDENPSSFNEIVQQIALNKFQLLNSVRTDLRTALEHEKFLAENPGLAAIEEIIRFLNEWQKKYQEECFEEERKHQQEYAELNRKLEQEYEEKLKQQEQKRLEEARKYELEQAENEITRKQEILEKEYEHYKRCCWHDHQYELVIKLHEEYNPARVLIKNIILVNLILGIFVIPLLLAFAATLYQRSLENEFEEKREAILSTEAVWLGEPDNYLSKEAWLTSQKKQQPENNQSDISIDLNSYTQLWKEPPDSVNQKAPSETPSKIQSLGLDQ